MYRRPLLIGLVVGATIYFGWAVIFSNQKVNDAANELAIPSYKTEVGVSDGDPLISGPYAVVQTVIAPSGVTKPALEKAILNQATSKGWESEQLNSENRAAGTDIILTKGIYKARATVFSDDGSNPGPAYAAVNIQRQSIGQMHRMALSVLAGTIIAIAFLLIQKRRTND